MRMVKEMDSVLRFIVSSIGFAVGYGIIEHFFCKKE